MEDNTVISQKISIDKLLSFKDREVKPIDGINIPNITVPQNLVSKKRPTEAPDTIIINIRNIFNTLTDSNIAVLKEQLRQIVYAKAQKPEMLSDIADEILEQFLVCEKNIKNYMHLLNAIWNVSILIQNSPSEKKIVSPHIGIHFLNKCKDTIFKLISEENIRELGSLAEPAESDPNSDEADKYYSGKDRITNLIIVLCFLYEQRNTVLIKLTAVQLYTVIKNILDSYTKYQKQMVKLGNPDDGECENEDEYEILARMCAINVDLLYTFFLRKGEDFLKDEIEIKDKTGKVTIKVLMDRFNKEVVPTFEQTLPPSVKDYWISVCNDMISSLTLSA